jgi:futalosine hydrolase
LRILVVAATPMEVAPLVAVLQRVRAVTPRLESYRHGRHDVDVLTTGVGMVATAVWCSDRLVRERYDLALNVGVCGAFEPTLPLAGAVHVVADTFAELGAEDGDRFLSLEELGLLGPDEFPFRGGRIVNPAPPANPVLRGLRSVSGITVNTVHGEERSIAAVVARLQPEVESMEGAAFLYAALVHGVACAQVRVVSNVVARRNRAAWKMTESIAELGRTALAILEAQ